MVERWGSKAGEALMQRCAGALHKGLYGACDDLGSDDAAAEQRARAVLALVRALKEVIAFEDSVRTLPLERDDEEIRAELVRRLDQYAQRAGAPPLSPEPEPD